MISFLLIIFAGILQGSFGLGMKRFQPLSWEAFWFIFSLMGMIVIPFVWSSLVIPDLFKAITFLSVKEMFTSIILGACWGAGAIMFGYSVNYIGISLSYGITMGLAAAVGSLQPLLTKENGMEYPGTPYILVGIGIILAGITVLTMAGIKRDKLQQIENSDIKGVKRGKIFYLGLLFAFLNGVFAAFLNVGFTIASPVTNKAVELGAKPYNASLPSWIIVLFGGFILNFGYALFLLIKNKSFKTLTTLKSHKGIIWGFLTSLIWFSALGIYGMGATLLGEMGPVIGWTMFLALSLVVSNTWGILEGEWKNSAKPFRIMLIGNSLLIISWILLGYSNNV
jgi:L-rhamnose-H+ transport protein